MDVARGERSLRRPAQAKDLLRFITCGSVDDGKSTLIGRLAPRFQADLRGPADGAGGRLPRAMARPAKISISRFLVDGLEAEREQGITIDVAYRFFSTAQAIVHRRRYAGPRAIHAQHGDRRLDRRACHHPDRCAQGRAGADAAAFADLLAAWHPPRGAVAVNKIDLVDFNEETFDEIASRLQGLRRHARLCFDHANPDFGPLRRQRHEPHRPIRRGIAGRRCCNYLETIDIETRASRQAVPLSGAVGQSAEPRFSRLCRDGRVGPCQGRRCDRARRHRGARRGSERIVTYDGAGGPSRGRRRRHDDAHGRNRYRPRRRPGQPRSRGPRSPISSPRTSSG